MKQDAMIWRQAIYDGGFICRCGADLTLENALKTGRFEGREYKICRKCAYVVAKIDQIEVPERLAPGKYGSIIEFERRTRRMN